MFLEKLKYYLEKIKDVNLCPGKDMAFIRFKHRCLAEFAKEAM